MRQINYADFDLTIERSGPTYRVRVESPAGDASSDFALPFTAQDIELFILRMGRTRGPVRRIETPGMEAAKEFGGRLYDAVFTGDVDDMLRSSLDDITHSDSGLRIRLRVSSAPELADLPWEFLYNRRKDQFIGLSDQTPIVRYVDLPERIKPLHVSVPLNVLVMISGPRDVVELDAEREWMKLKEALGELEDQGRVALTRLDRATLTDLQRQLRRGEYHVFHFIGHGGFDPSTDDGLLLLEDDQGREKRVSGQFVGAFLRDHRSLQLAVLNACDGARTSRTDPFAGVAQSLVLQGTPAVIAMQFEITDAAAVAFSGEFYGAIADGYPVDAALTEARKAVLAQPNDTEWATPVLYMRSPDGRIFDVEARPNVSPTQPPQQATDVPTSKVENGPLLEMIDDASPKAGDLPIKNGSKQAVPTRADTYAADTGHSGSASAITPSRTSNRYRSRAVAVMVSCAVGLLIATLGVWGGRPAGVGEVNAWARQAELIVVRPDVADAGLLSVGFVLALLALAIVAGAVGRRPLVSAVAGGLTVVASFMFSLNFYGRAADNTRSLQNQKIADAGFLASVGWGTWLAIAVGLATIVSIVVLRVTVHSRPDGS